MSNTQQQGRSECHGAGADNRAAGFTCLPNWLSGHVTPSEGWLLWTLQSFAPRIHPSLELLAERSGLARSSVCRLLAGMKRKGWIRTERRFTPQKRCSSTVYHLLIWELAPGAPPCASPVKPAVSPSDGQPETSVELAVSPSDGSTQRPPEAPDQPSDHETGTVRSSDPNKKEITRKSNPTAKNPPSPPTGERRPPAVDIGPCRDEGRPWGPGRDRDGFLLSPLQAQQPARAEQPEPREPESPMATQPQPQQPNAPLPVKPAETPRPAVPVNPKGQKRRAGFQPDHGDVPAALLPVVRELLAFWPTRRGAKTAAAWELLCRELQRIQDHPQGGTEIVRGQLEEGAMAGIDGRAWQSIRFKNWLAYGTKACTPVIGSGFARRMTPEDSAAAAVAFIRARDAREQAQQALDDAMPVLAEVCA